MTVTIPTMKQQPPASPDDNGGLYRKIYFMRASLRTLSEVRGGIPVLVAKRRFTRYYKRWDKKRFLELKDFLAELARNLEEFIRIRDAFGGHVLSPAVEKALKTMDFGEQGRYEVGPTMNETHFSFAATICVQALLQAVPKKERDAYLHGIFAVNMETTKIITGVFTAHSKRKKLLNPT